MHIQVALVYIYKKLNTLYESLEKNKYIIFTKTTTNKFFIRIKSLSYLTLALINKYPLILKYLYIFYRKMVIYKIIM